MKKAASIVLVLVFGLSACAKGTTIGGKGLGGRSDIGGGQIESSESPTPTKTKTNKPRETQEPTQEPTPTEPAYDPVTYTVVIRGTNNFYEWKGGAVKDYRLADSGGPRVFVGDIVIFKNMDTRGTKHSLTNGNQGARDFGKVFDLGPIEPGDQVKWTVTNKPGCYYYTDRIVNYYRGGPMQIVDREAEEVQACS